MVMSGVDLIGSWLTLKLIVERDCEVLFPSKHLPSHPEFVAADTEWLQSSSISLISNGGIVGFGAEKSHKVDQGSGG